MKRLSLRTKVLLAFVLPVVALVVTSVMIYQALSISLSTNRDIALVNQRIATLNGLLAAVADAESSERAFVITGDEQFLKPYAEAVNRFRATATAMKGLAGGDRVQLSRIGRVEESFSIWQSAGAEPEIQARRAAPVKLIDASRTAYSLLLESWRVETKYAASRNPRDLAVWQNLFDQCRTHLVDISTLERAPAKAAEWRKTIAAADAYKAALMTAAGTPETLDSWEASLGRRRDELTTLVEHMASYYEIQQNRLTRFVTAGTGTALVSEIRREISEIAQSQKDTLRSHVTASEQVAGWSRLVVLAGPAAAIGAALTVVLVISLGIVRGVSSVARAAQGLAAGDLTHRAPVRGNDEVAVMAQAFNALADRLAGWTCEVTLLSQMNDMLQACATTEEAHATIGKFAAQLFPNDAGALFILSPSGNLVERAVAWGALEQHDESAVFVPDECWALRRGRVHLVTEAGSGLPCKHVSPPLPAASVCIPLIAHGEALGVLHLQQPSDSPNAARLADEGTQRLARTVAEQVSLALANIGLRETLSRQSLRDPLTGLFNRRYMEVTLERELRRAERGGLPMGVIMADLDQFKQFNDTFGHPAGDALLREFGHLLQTIFRAEDIICRYGGEEFALILPDATLEHTCQRAEDLREATKRMQVTHRGEELGAVTISLGVAGYPEHGSAGEVLLRAADAALYQAKREGRDRSRLAENTSLRRVVQGSA